MKFRNDFVTNSSSSSFICEVCGNVEGGYDYSLEDAGMCKCENGHTICENHVKESAGFTAKKEMLLREIQRLLDYYTKNNDESPNDSYTLRRLVELTDNKDFVTNLTEDEYDEDYDKEDKFNDLLSDFDLRHTIPKESCPICNHDVVTDKQLLEYATSKLGITLKELTDTVRQYLIEADKEKNK